MDNRPSRTALLIAKSTAFLYHDRRFGHLVPPFSRQASVWFMEACSRHAKYEIKSLDKMWFRFVIRGLERLTIPGITLHYALRKRWLEEVVRSGIQQGFNQILILGAGFDTLALRLHLEFPEVQFLEIDHPATQQVKKQALEKRGLPRANMELLALDLTRQDLEQALRANRHYCPSADSLFIAEGLLMYLTSFEVSAVFRLVVDHEGQRSRFAFTFMEPQADGRVSFRNSGKTVDWLLRLRGEPFRWGIKREVLASYLQSRGLVLREVATPERFRRRYLAAEDPADVSLPQGENVCVAERP